MKQKGTQPIKSTLTLLTTLLLAQLTTVHAAETAKPNVLLIMSDDLRDFGGAFTREVVKTPNLDRLRARGTTFERAFVQHPVCNPSRSSMMTSLRTEQTGIFGNDILLRDKLPNVETLPQLCKASGWQARAFRKLYRTGERLWWNKNTLFERSCRAPIVIAGPGMKGAQVSRSLVEFVDLYPTVADFCGLKMAHFDAGTSLRPVLANPATRVKDAALTLISRSARLPAQSVRTERWRITRWSDGRNVLYDHDPEVLHDVAEQHPSVVKELADRIKPLPKFTPGE